MKKPTRDLAFGVAAAAIASRGSAHGIGIAEVGFAAEMLAFLGLVAALVMTEKALSRALLLVVVFSLATLSIWVVVFGVLGSVRGAVPANGDVPLTLFVGLLGAALLVARVRRSKWLQKSSEAQLAQRNSK